MLQPHRNVRFACREQTLVYETFVLTNPARLRTPGMQRFVETIHALQPPTTLRSKAIVANPMQAEGGTAVRQADLGIDP